MHNWRPSRDYHPDLSLARLMALATLHRTVWRRVSELHEPEEGDDMWSMSCRAFIRCTHQLKRRSQGEWHWLTVTEAKKMQLVLSIGVIPARFYHGDVLEDVPARYAQPSDTEKVARQGVLNFSDGIRGLVRLVTKTDSKGVPLNVTLVEYDEYSQQIINWFAIPEADSAGPSGVVEFPSSQPKPGVIQPKPSARPRTGRVKEQGDDAE